MNKRKIIWIISAVCVVAVVITAICLTKCSGKGAIVCNTEQVQENTVETTVTATGYVQPVDKVEVGTQVSGVIEKIFVDFNSQVKKGQLLAELDKSTLVERVTQAQASLTSAESDLSYAQQNYNRVKGLYDQKAATEAAYEEALNRLTQAQTTVANQKANLHQAKVNLSYAEIYSPIDGVILDRAVEEGQTVAASFSTPTMFTIANDLKNMQVEANVDEADIGNVKKGQKVSFTVDAYSDLTFSGTVEQIRLQPVVSNNVVTYTVIIAAPNPDEKLFPGMTASITIITRNEKGVTVSNEALNFVPTEQVFALYKMDAKPKGKPANNELKGDFTSMSPVRGSSSNMKTVWIETTDGKIEPRAIEIGLTDGINTIVTQGLEKGETVIVSANEVEKTSDGASASNPLIPGPPKRK